MPTVNIDPGSRDASFEESLSFTRDSMYASNICCYYGTVTAIPATKSYLNSLFPLGCTFRVSSQI